MRSQGKITSWKDEQGFGFITPSRGGERVFVHIKAFANKTRRPVGNEIVTYELAADPMGRARAQNVAFLGERSRRAFAFGRRSFFLLVATLFVSVVAAWTYVGKLPAVVSGFYVAASIVAFTVYVFDKLAAENGWRRTPESTLHMLGLAGGWPGALVAQGLLRHKSKKQPFQFVFWVTVMLNCGALIWLLTPHGSEAALRVIVDATAWLKTAWR